MGCGPTIQSKKAAKGGRGRFKEYVIRMLSSTERRRMRTGRFRERESFTRLFSAGSYEGMGRGAAIYWER